MVVGNGLIAQAFSSFKDIQEITIFASGVSNSNVVNVSELEREIKLLTEYLNKDACLVYFSTVSLYDSSVENSQYIQHKRTVEALITEKCKDYLILRIPIVVGNSSNIHTLTNNLVSQIRNSSALRVFKKASRYLMDIDSIVETVTPIILDKTHHNSIWNICFNNRINIEEIIATLEEILNTEVEKEYLDKGCCYEVPNQKFITYLNSVGYEVPKDYIKLTLQKYYSNLN